LETSNYGGKPSQEILHSSNE